MRENEMVGWHHRLNGHEFEQTPGDRRGRRSQECSSPWDCKELDVDTTEQLSNKQQYGEGCCKGKHQIQDVFSTESKEGGCEVEFLQS